MKLAVAFLCYNQSSAPYLSEFLPSLETSLAKIKGDIIILAGDNSDQAPYTNNLLIDAYNRQAQYPARLISFEKNLGFAAGYNRLIAQAKNEQADYFLMLNPDMLIHQEMVTELIQSIDSQKELAVVVPKIYSWDFASKKISDIIDSCGLILKPGLRFSDLGQGKKDDGSFDQNEIFGASGAAACFRMSALSKIMVKKQYFDERFFMYKEDCDLAYRLYLANLKTKLVSTAIAYHDRSVSAKAGVIKTLQDWRQRSRQTRTWSFVNQHLLWAKHWRHEGLGSQILIGLQIIFFAIFSLIFAPFLLKSYHLIRNNRRGLD